MPDGDDEITPPPSAWDRLSQLPDLDAAPLEAPWMDAPEPPVAQPSPSAPAEPATDATAMGVAAAGPENAQYQADRRHFHVRAAEPTAPGAPAPLVMPGQPSEPGPQIGAEAPAQRPRRRRSRRGLVVALIAVPILLVVAFVLYSWFLWGQVDRIDTDNALSPPSSGFTNYLIVGVDSRDGVDPSLSTANQIGLRVEGSRSDTMVLLHVSDAGNRLVSIPRDLWVDIDGFRPSKLNAATALGGAPTLIRTVKNALDVPVHHYLEVDIAGFLSVVEAVGSISIDFPAPACDPKSGLDVRQTGMVSLDEEQALAYVRSRTYTEFEAAPAAGMNCTEIRSAGLGSTVNASDFGRTERQRRFLLAVFDKVSATRNPVTILRVQSGLKDGLAVDDTMGMRNAFDLLRDLRGLNAESTVLPVSDFTAPDSSAALMLNGESAPVLEGLR